MTALGGILLVGRTGMGAALHHSPEVNGLERFVFYSMPHIAIDEFGTIGSVLRPGQSHRSSACGALKAFSGEIDSGHLNVIQDNDDLEYTLLKQKVSNSIPYGTKPSLVELTKIVQKVVLAELEKLIALYSTSILKPEKANYAVISGVQIHGPNWLKKKDMDYVWVGEAYSVIKGEKAKLPI